MNTLKALTLLLALGGTAFTAFGQNTPGLKSLALSKVKVNPAVYAAAQKERSAFDRIAQGMDGQLMDRLHNTRKFQVMARSDADALIEEAGATGNSFSFTEADYLLVVTIDDFQDVIETMKFEALDRTARRRTIRFSTGGKIYDQGNAKDGQLGALLESTNFQISEVLPEEVIATMKSTGDLSDALIIQLAREMSQKIAQRVTDVITPAKVIGKTGKVVTFNRGDGTFVEADQEWEVFAVGEEMIDPDTGMSLGAEEVSVGKVRVTRVTPKFSQAVILEDYGIERGSVLRQVLD